MKSYFSNFKIIQKFGLLFSLILASMVLSYAVVFWFNSNQKIQRVQIDVAGRNRMLSQRIGGMALLIDTDSEAQSSIAKEEMRKAVVLMEQTLNVLKDGGIAPGIEGNIKLPPAQKVIVPKIVEVLDFFQGHKEIANVLLNESRLLSSLSADSTGSAKVYNPIFKESLDKLRQRLLNGTLLKMNVELVQLFTKEAAQSKNVFVMLLILLSTNAAIIGFAFFSLRKTLKPLEVLNEHISSLSVGYVPPPIKVDQSDEIGQMAKTLNALSENLGSATDFAKNVGEGNLETNVVVFNGKGELSQSLSLMRDNLKLVAEEDRKRNWSISGLAKLGDILRNQDQNLEKFGEQVLSFIVKYSNSNQGRLYVVNDDIKNQECLQMIACYAWDKKKFVEQRIERGDGLTGQCWQEGEPIYMTQVPENYVSITSGLGLANPRNIFIVPLKVNEGIFGVLELASFKLLEEYERNFIVKLSENLAAAISTVRINDRTKQLLEQSQQQAEEMKAQEEEMRQNMEELTATQEEMQRKESEMLGHLDAINNSQAFIEFDLEGNIIHANDIFLRTMKYSLNEIKGKHHRLFVDSSYAASQEYSEFWRSFKDGKAKSGEFLRKAKDGSKVWLSANYTPVINAQGVAVKVIKLARDISKEKQLLEQSHQQAEELKAQEEELKQNMEELSAIQEDMQRKETEMLAQLKAIDNSQAFIEFDLDGKIINANDMFLQTMKYSLNEIKGKHHRMFVDKDYADSPEYRDFWKTFSEEKSKSGEFLRKAKDGSSVWLSANYTPVVDPQGRVLKVIKLARNISEAKLLQQQSQKQAEVMKAQEERMAQKEKEYLKRIKELEREPTSSIAK
jgi:PAS domain S-box-containing protein